MINKKYLFETKYPDGEVEFCFCTKSEQLAEKLRLKNLGVKVKIKIYRNVSNEILKKLQ